MTPKTRTLVKRALIRDALTRAPPGEHFTLASGVQTDTYCDVKKAALHSETMLHLAALLVKEFLPVVPDCTALAGVSLGGCHLASSTAMYAKVHYVGAFEVLYMRKETKGYGTKSRVEAPCSLLKGGRVVLLEDVVTTGDSVLSAADALTQEGFSVKLVLSVVDRRPWFEHYLGGGKYPYRALFALDELLADDLSGNAPQEGV